MKKFIMLAMSVLFIFLASSCSLLGEKETDFETDKMTQQETESESFDESYDSYSPLVETEPDFEVSNPLTPEDETRIISAGNKLLEHWAWDIYTHTVESIDIDDRTSYIAVDPKYGPASIEEARQQLTKYFTEEYADAYIKENFLEQNGILYKLHPGYYLVCRWELSDFIRLSEKDGRVMYFVFPGEHNLTSEEDKQNWIDKNMMPYEYEEMVVIEDGKISEMKKLDYHLLLDVAGLSAEETEMDRMELFRIIADKYDAEDFEKVIEIYEKYDQNRVY